jgi:predicted nucleic acid-binding protein
MKVFIDSNIPMYVAGAEHEHREPARRFLERVEKHEIEACTSTAVLEEILSRYAGLDRRDLAGRIYDLFVEACPEVLDVTLADTDRARDLIANAVTAIPRHAIHAAVMMNHEIEWIATFDREFDRIAGIRRMKLA